MVCLNAWWTEEEVKLQINSLIVVTSEWEFISGALRILKMGKYFLNTNTISDKNAPKWICIPLEILQCFRKYRSALRDILVLLQTYQNVFRFLWLIAYELKRTLEILMHLQYLHVNFVTLHGRGRRNCIPLKISILLVRRFDLYLKKICIIY